MKTIITILSLSLGVSLVNAQTLKEADVPKAVKDAFTKQYPGVKAEKWEKEGNNYEVEIHVNKVETSVVYGPNGNLLETEVEISVSELPKAAQDYITKNVPGKKIKEASKITTAKGEITYEAEVGGEDYLFDASGNFIKKESEKDNDD
jgi:hypothetical protein